MTDERLRRRALEVAEGRDLDAGKRTQEDMAIFRRFAELTDPDRPMMAGHPDPRETPAEGAKRGFNSSVGLPNSGEPYKKQ